MTQFRLMEVEHRNSTIWASVDSQFPDMIFVHANVSYWDRSERIVFGRLWNLLQRRVKDVGYPKIHMVVPNYDMKLVKFAMMYGMKVERVIESSAKILMVKEL